MSALITINFAGGTATSNNVFVALENSAVATGTSSGVSLAMTSGVTNITVYSNEIGIATAYNAEFNGSLAITISWTSDQKPTVTLNNIQHVGSNQPTVTWPTSGGPETQILTPGEPIVLDGIVNS